MTTRKQASQVRPRNHVKHTSMAPRLRLTPEIERRLRDAWLGGQDLEAIAIDIDATPQQVENAIAIHAPRWQTLEARRRAILARGQLVDERAIVTRGDTPRLGLVSLPYVSLCALARAEEAR